MGSGHSIQTAGKRHSLVAEEFVFSEHDFAWDCECKVYHMDLELKPLPSHVRHTTHICVDDYTQEILSGEEEGKCACASRADKTVKWWTFQDESDKDKLNRCPESGSGADVWMQWDMYLEEHNVLQSEQSGVDSAANDLHQNRCTEGSMNSFTEIDLEGAYKDHCRQRQKQGSPRTHIAAEANIPCGKETEIPAAQNNQTAPKESDDMSNRVEHGQTTPLVISSQLKRQRCLSDSERGSKHAIFDRQFSTTCFETDAAVKISESNSVEDQTPECSKDGVNTRRKSCPIPVPLNHTKAASSKSSSFGSRQRKVSLKGEPGWIPNPLDSDSDSNDMADSGVFSDFTGSPPSMSTSPAHSGPFDPTLTKKPRTIFIPWRRRHNSEPVSTTSTSPTFSTQSDTTSTSKDYGKGSGARPKTWRSTGSWRLLRFSKRASSPQEISEKPIEAEDSSQDEDDLSELLKWITMSDSTTTTESSSEQHQEDSYTSETSQAIGNSCEEVAETREPSQLSSKERNASDRHRSRCFDGELELDWLCEPEWNNLELELFWSVLRPHLEHLLQPEDSDLLPDPCGSVCCTDAEDPKMLDRCLLHVQWHIWKGSYRQAVSDFRAIRRHFLCCAQSQLIESSTRDDVENLRLLFQRKRPTRFRLWI